LVEGALSGLRSHPESSIGRVNRETGNLGKWNVKGSEQCSIQGVMLYHPAIPLRKPQGVVGFVTGDAEIMNRSLEEKIRAAPIGIEFIDSAIIVID
jgi:hypothetical protein